jgi:hypothetical protein
MWEGPFRAVVFANLAPQFLPLRRSNLNFDNTLCQAGANGSLAVQGRCSVNGAVQFGDNLRQLFLEAPQTSVRNMFICPESEDLLPF